jgi:hypothetical protein
MSKHNNLMLTKNKQHIAQFHFFVFSSFDE